MQHINNETNTKLHEFNVKRKGMEVLQLAIIIVLAVGLIGVIAGIMSSVRGKLETANQSITTGMNDPSWGLDTIQNAQGTDTIAGVH